MYLNCLAIRVFLLAMHVLIEYSIVNNIEKFSKITHVPLK